MNQVIKVEITAKNETVGGLKYGDFLWIGSWIIL